MLLVVKILRSIPPPPRALPEGRYPAPLDLFIFKQTLRIPNLCAIIHAPGDLSGLAGEQAGTADRGMLARELADAIPPIIMHVCTAKTLSVDGVP